MRSFVITAVMLALFGLFFVGCSTDSPVQTSTPTSVSSAIGSGSFTIEAKYTYIRSYPTGGGVFVFRLVPGADFTGDVSLNVTADKTLGAALRTTTINAESSIGELTLSPTRKAPFGLHTITLTASNGTHQEVIQLEAELISWGILSMNVANDKQDEFIDWLKVEHPELGNLSSVRWDMYGTYPGIKIVEHYTYLSEEWEFRICFHVMIPPDDWSQMSLRRRGEWDATLAAMREWDDVTQTYVIHEIPIEEYPVIFDY